MKAQIILRNGWQASDRERKLTLNAFQHRNNKIHVHVHRVQHRAIGAGVAATGPKVHTSTCAHIQSIDVTNSATVVQDFQPYPHFTNHMYMHIHTVDVYQLLTCICNMAESQFLAEHFH